MSITYGILQCLVPFLQTQNIVFPPMMISSGITTLLHILVRFSCSSLASEVEELHWQILCPTGLMFYCWLFMLNFLLRVPKLRRSGKQNEHTLHLVFTKTKTWIQSMNISICDKHEMCYYNFSHPIWYDLNSLEMWSFEIMVLLSGLLPSLELETSVLSIRFLSWLWNI